MTKARADSSGCWPASVSGLVGASVVIGLLAGPVLGNSVHAEPPRPVVMLVQLAEGLAVDPAAQTLRLVKADGQTIYFADRPVRMAGHVSLDDYLKEWTARAGADNFGNNPPTATLSVYEAGKTENTLSVVEISHPKVEGADLVYNYRKLDGTVPVTGGATSLFIDWTEVGDSFGFGFRGVGVGFRGPGVL